MSFHLFNSFFVPGVVPQGSIHSSIQFLLQLCEVYFIQPHTQVRKVRLRVKCLKLYDHHSRGALNSGSSDPEIPVLFYILLDLV